MWQKRSLDEFVGNDEHLLVPMRRLWILLLWMLVEKKLPYDWLSWELPYASVEEGVGLLTSDQAEFRAFVDVVGTGYLPNAVGIRLIANLNIEHGHAAKKFTAQLREELNRAKAPLTKWRIIAICGYLLVLLGYAASLIIESKMMRGYRATETMENGLGLAVIAALFASPGVYVVIKALRNRTFRMSIEQKHEQSG